MIPRVISLGQMWTKFAEEGVISSLRNLGSTNFNFLAQIRTAGSLGMC
jgi:hypothetical protein